MTGALSYRRRARKSLRTAGPRLRAAGWSDETVRRLLAAVAARRPKSRDRLEAVVTDVLYDLAATGEHHSLLGAPHDVDTIMAGLLAR